MAESTIQNEAEGNVDRLVQQAFFKGDNHNKLFIDVGAARPDYLSISALFRSSGWRVIAVEPNPVFVEMHKQRGHEIYQYACGDHDEDDVDFLMVNSHGVIYENGPVSYESFSSLGIKDSYATLKSDLDITKIKVNLRRLDTILRQHAPDVGHIDILSIDVEGWELEVLAGLNIGKYRPSVIIVENLFNENKYRNYMSSLNYSLWNQFPPNEVYISKALRIRKGIQRRLKSFMGVFRKM